MEFSDGVHLKNDDRVHHHVLTVCPFVLEDVEGRPEQGLVADIPKKLSSHGLKVLQSSCALIRQPTAL